MVFFTSGVCQMLQVSTMARPCAQVPYYYCFVSCVGVESVDTNIMCISVHTRIHRFIEVHAYTYQVYLCSIHIFI